LYVKSSILVCNWHPHIQPNGTLYACNTVCYLNIYTNERLTQMLIKNKLKMLNDLKAEHIVFKMVAILI